MRGRPVTINAIKRLQVLVPVSLWNRLIDWCRQRKRSRSEVVRDAVERYIEDN